MNENHERHLLTTFRHIDNLLAEAEHILATAGSNSPFAEYTQDSTPVQRKVMHDYIERVRQAMFRAMEDLRLPRPAPICGARWAAGGRFTFTQIAVAEIEPQRMKGYGSLSEEDVKAINEVVAELNATLERLIAYWNKGPDTDLQARLERLEKISDEAQLFRELERVVTAHGLIEFRGVLAMLLERLENHVFEVGVFGRVSSGKSSLLNYLLGSAVLPVGVTPVTAFPTRVSYGAEARATVAFAEEKPEVIELSRLAEFVTEQQNPGNAKHVMRITAQLPSPRLRTGVTFVDTPGLGSLATDGAEETMAYLPRCDLGLVLVDAGSTVTHEDLAIVQALYHSEARAMVLVSKADMLSPTDLRQTVNYVEQQLRAQAGMSLKVHPVSVLGQGVALCNEWLEKEMMPLVEAHREQSSAAIKRKVGALREAVVKVLESRLGGLRRGGSTASPSQDQEAIQALRKADALFEAAQREGEPILDNVPSLSGDLLDRVAADLAANWGSAEAAGLGKSVARSINRLLSGQMFKLKEILTSTRTELGGRLNLVQETLAGTGGNPEVLPAPTGAPIPDLAPLIDRINLERPRLLSKLGKRFVRGHIRQQLEKALEPGLRDFLSRYRRQLRGWFEISIVELRDSFAARAGVCRAQLEGRVSEPEPEPAAVQAELRADLLALQNWGQERPLNNARLLVSRESM